MIGSGAVDYHSPRPIASFKILIPNRSPRTQLAISHCPYAFKEPMLVVRVREKRRERTSVTHRNLPFGTFWDKRT
jgi:hypothetical protein